MPHAAVQPDKTHQYKAIFEAVRAASEVKGIIPALEDAAALRKWLCVVPCSNSQRGRRATIGAGRSILANHAVRHSL